MEYTSQINQHGKLTFILGENMILGTSLAAGGINDDWSQEGNRRGPDSGSCAKPSGTSRRVSAMAGSVWSTSAFKLGLRGGALPYVGHCLQNIQKNSCRFQYAWSRVKCASWLHHRCVMGRRGPLGRVSAMAGSVWSTSAFKLGLRGALPYVDTVSKKSRKTAVGFSMRGLV